MHVPRNTCWISARSFTGRSHLSSNRLQHERHVRAGSFVYGNRLLFPYCIDVLVQLSIDTGAGATIVMSDA